MKFNDALTINGSRRTGDGYLVVNARSARGGNIQLYAGSEVGRPEMAEVRVYRPADEVFDKDAMQSFAHRPVTLGHPSSAVTADNWRAVAKGWSAGDVARDGEFIRVDMLLADAEIIRAVEQGTNQLSMGYDCELVWGAGRTPIGESFDAKQVRIRANHIAVVPAARGGPQLRIGDAAASTERKELHMMTDAEHRAMRDSVRGMPVAQAAALRLYDNFRGRWQGGMPMDQYYAIRDGAVAGESIPAPEVERARAAYDEMCRKMSMQYREPGRAIDSRDGPQFTHALDGRDLASLDERERAYEEMKLRMQGGYR